MMHDDAQDKTIISMIAAHDTGLLIGREGSVPWKLKEDLRHFKNTTYGHPVLMGRKTFEEIGEKPLPGRPCYVLTSRRYQRDDVTTFRSVDEALKYFRQGRHAYDKVFVIGGGQIYRLFLPQADELIISEVHKSYEGDTFFPDYRQDIGRIWEEETGKRQEYDDFTVKVYRRKSS
jgi:dihydrofolate reductase